VRYEANGRPRALVLLLRGWRLQCPRCGARTLFRTWLRMHERCAVCGLRFEREQGYFVGAIYLNYAVTVVIVISGYFLLALWTAMSLAQQLVLWGLVSLVCPLLLFRRTRGLWLGFDFIFNPVRQDASEDDKAW